MSIEKKPKRVIRVVIDVEIAEDAFAPFGATSADQEHTYYQTAVAHVAIAVERMYQTQAAGGRFVSSQLLRPMTAGKSEGGAL
jgi:hypothetical protein